MRLLYVFIAITFVGVGISGCCTAPPRNIINYTLTIKGKMPVIVDNAVTADFKTKKFKKIMIVPPSGTARGVFEKNLTLAEKEFIKRGLTIISPAVTARVTKGPGDNGGKTEGQAHLSDVERALILAKKSGADGVLQLSGAFDWQNGTYMRYFISNATTNEFEEVEQEVYEFTKDSTRRKHVEYGALFRFTAKLIDVESGEVMIVFDVWQSDLRNLPMDYTARYTYGGLGYVKQNGQFVLNKDGTYKMAPLFSLVPNSENWDMSDARWRTKARWTSEKQVYTSVAKVISNN